MQHLQFRRISRNYILLPQELHTNEIASHKDKHRQEKHIPNNFIILESRNFGPSNNTDRMMQKTIWILFCFLFQEVKPLKQGKIWNKDCIDMTCLTIINKFVPSGNIIGIWPYIGATYSSYTRSTSHVRRYTGMRHLCMYHAYVTSTNMKWKLPFENTLRVSAERR